MRLSSASLLLGSTSVLSALLVSAAPVLVRISLVENVPSRHEQADDLIRFIRIGGPGAMANIHTPDLDRINTAILHSGILADLDSDAPVRIEREYSNPVSMRPELEWTPDQQTEEMRFEPVAQDVIGCSNGNVWQRMLGRINNFFVDIFGFPTEKRSVQCGAAQAPVRPMPDLPKFVSPSTPTSVHSVESSVPYHRNGASIAMMPPPNFYPPASPRFRPWVHRRPTTFGGRLHRALHALSPWEGRAVAFVMGCGLGVLIRMLFVLVVLGARALSGRSRIALDGDDEDKDEHDGIRVVLGDEEVEGVVLFDAGSIKGASVEDLPLYEEKQ